MLIQVFSPSTTNRVNSALMDSSFIGYFKQTRKKLAITYGNGSLHNSKNLVFFTHAFHYRRIKRCTLGKHPSFPHTTLQRYSQPKCDRFRWALDIVYLNRQPCFSSLSRWSRHIEYDSLLEMFAAKVSTCFVWFATMWSSIMSSIIRLLEVLQTRHECSIFKDQEMCFIGSAKTSVSINPKKRSLIP